MEGIVIRTMNNEKDRQLFLDNGFHFHNVIDSFPGTRLMKEGEGRLIWESLGFRI